jgi:hypothetical protein
MLSFIAQESDDRDTQLQSAGKRGAARELFEETGLNVQSQLDRLKPAQLGNGGSLPNEHKDRLFFFLNVNDSDFTDDGVHPMSDQGGHLKVSFPDNPMTITAGSWNLTVVIVLLQLKLSDEHSGFIFQPEPVTSAGMLKVHSGGKVSQALLMATSRADDSTGAVRTTPPWDLLPPPRQNKSGFCCFGIGGSG